LRAGKKLTHWMWFVFPQIAGLGRTSTARFFAIADRREAEIYDRHAVLGPRLRECTAAMMTWAEKRDAEAILGPIDVLKFRSSMTLFDAVAQDDHRFVRALAAFNQGERDALTLELL
jgi:uncharacterized protein (DUF1810 family)